ncbi:hypothetical protein [Nocardioides coralli]|uniref:hypothetical protein n=1 Tax=Nocardioides coralli TaxID=2872154 RepID=UPI001CA39A1E|nr:hypothetical protein [Nocardioides coralli]QZY29148.1 hypothetical protein K6T13_17265 [Nocardioides coralli]
MTDDQPELTPAEEAEVRRRLAEARHTEPLPPEVADRLDRVLADLDAEPAPGAQPAGVVRLAERRRRAATLLVAAAAVVVGGVAVGQVVGGLGDDASPEAVTAGDAESDTAQGGAQGEGGSEAPADAEELARGGEGDVAPGSVVATIRPGRFGEDVARLRATPRAELAERGAPASPGEQACVPGDWGRGAYRAVRYGESIGYVVFRRTQGDTQVADLFLCGGEDAVRSVTLPTP